MRLAMHVGFDIQFGEFVSRVNRVLSVNTNKNKDFSSNQTSDIQDIESVSKFIQLDVGIDLPSQSQVNYNKFL